jgi:hypothetical protein
MSFTSPERTADTVSRVREVWTGNSAQLSGCVRYAQSLVLGALVAFGLVSGARAEPPEEGRYHELVEVCRKASRPIFLAEDKSFLCFDGDVLEDQDYSKVDSLQPGGVFVVRSQGGYGFEALKIATVLERKKAVAVVHDYCLSACAGFFLIAVERVYVVRNSIVAWHDGSTGPETDCVEIKTVRTPYGAQRQLERSFCAHFLAGDDIRFSKHRQVYAMQRDLNWRRRHRDQIGGGTPQSIHIRRELLRRYDATGRYPDVLWMWHPRNYKSAIRTQITYEAYPETQEEIDILTRRIFGPYATRLILYDP